jgi:type II secretory pathway pseudopilin PulG
MENASKALLIAGAILVVIVLISVGMLIVNSTQDVTEQAGSTATSQAIQAFNQQFTQYQGTQKGSTIKTLYQSYQASNAANSEHPVTWATGGSNISVMSTVNNSKKYKVQLGYGSDGYVNSITVTVAGATPTST